MSYEHKLAVNWRWRRGWRIWRRPTRLSPGVRNFPSWERTLDKRCAVCPESARPCRRNKTELFPCRQLGRLWSWAVWHRIAMPYEFVGTLWATCVATDWAMQFRNRIRVDYLTPAVHLKKDHFIMRSLITLDTLTIVTLEFLLKKKESYRIWVES